MYQRTLVFGGTGSLGTTIISNWRFVDRFYVYSRDEYKQWNQRQQFPNTEYILGDISDYQNVEKTILKADPTLIIIASAMKHVDRCQEYVEKCLDTNVLGLLNVLKAVEKIYSYKIISLKKIIFISTDKACEPVTIYGMSKGISEHIIQTRKWNLPIDIIAVRYGNVINSNGSIIPIFKNKIKNNEDITITDVNMTRFYMTLDQSVQLIKDAIDYGNSGEIWIPQLKSMKIIDLASIFAEKYNKDIKIIGLRCREKIHECLISKEEFLYTITKTGEYEDRYVIVSKIPDNSVTKKIYESSENNISKDELKILLEQYI